jgi:signal recognition particle subunit SRP54
MGPLREVMAKLPMFGDLADQVDEKELRRVEAMIQSMTRTERARPDCIDKSRAARIARGSGRRPKDVLDLVGRFGQMRQMMSALGGGGGGGLLSRIPGLGRLGGAGGGGLPAGMDPAALLGEGGGNRAARRRAAAGSKSQQKRKRKAARKARRKGRKK